MTKFESWKRLNRKTVYSTPHMRVFEDTVQLPNGGTIDDYSVVEMGDPVMVVATDQDGQVLILDEYRYATDQTMFNLPAGTITRGSEDPAAAALRELEEETGYTSTNITKMGEVYEYPTKATHLVHIFRVKGAVKKFDVKHEPSEQIKLRLLTPQKVKQAVFAGEVKTASVLSALVLAMPELFGNAKTD